MTGPHRPGSPLAAVALATSLLLIGAICPSSAAASKKALRGRTWVIAFDADTLGKPPAKSKVLRGKWAVVEDSSAAPQGTAAAAPAQANGAPAQDLWPAVPAAPPVPPDSGAASGDSAATSSAAPAPAPAPAAPALPRVLRQMDGDQSKAMNAIQFPHTSVENGEVSVRFRIRSGDIDPSAGILIGLDAKGRNGYLVRVSGAGGEIAAHYLIYGKRRDLKFQKVKTPEPGEWHTLAVRRDGITMTVLYDGKEVMQLRDERYGAGAAGLWTEDDTIADFTDVKVTAR